MGAEDRHKDVPIPMTARPAAYMPRLMAAPFIIDPAALNHQLENRHISEQSGLRERLTTIAAPVQTAGRRPYRLEMMSATHENLQI